MRLHEASNQLNIPSIEEFCLFQQFILKELGISLQPQKRAMLGHRLSKRLCHLKLDSFRDYYSLITDRCNSDEKQIALDLITTNETYFFREPKHFDFLSEMILHTYPKTRPFRVWSAACSTGEEPYSIAMLLEDKCPATWSLLATDVNCTVLKSARRAIYLDSRMSELSPQYRRRFCLKGQNAFSNHLRISPDLRTKVQFRHLNLLDDFKGIGKFELIFLRNVLIYFDESLKRKIILKIMTHLVPGGYLFVGHSESFHGIHPKLKTIQPAIMQFEPDIAS
ncbi:chemotaxis protein methyltransferase CheR [Oleiphilus messinensis]|uniref:Chemotaxis protein methyltransferase n=1 Tax=Oleiphilus messinensis TaxID=141451 RepID=A0A1Y0I8T5_9GAMM|nr:CheR family methyltransferase [Oleiphilus messinensis]ARU56922.1 chemotaxis protein methyltransferase CheR [Oleiphilus messinensis]